MINKTTDFPENTFSIYTTDPDKNDGQRIFLLKKHGPVVQSVVSLRSLLRVSSLNVLADSIHNILIFFAKKM